MDLVESRFRLRLERVKRRVRPNLVEWRLRFFVDLLKMPVRALVRTLWALV